LYLTSPAPTNPPDLHQLLVEHRDTLEKLFDLDYGQVWIGGGNMTRCLLIQRQRLDANLELCATPAQRLAVLQKAQEQAGKLYQRWLAAFTGNTVEVEQAHAAWQEIRIQWLREQLKSTPAKPKGP
jgi:hypothetical protein